MSQESPVRSATTSAEKWAPWWVYLIVIIGANFLRSQTIPLDTWPALAVVPVAVGQALILFGIVTVVWRLMNRTSS